MEKGNDLQILVSLKDEASAEFRKVGDNLSKTSGEISKKVGVLNKDVTGLSKTLLAGAAAGAGLAVAFGVSSIKAFAEAQKAMASVDATLRSMGQAAVENKDAILEAADAAVRLGFDDEDTAKSITRLYQATGSLTKAQDLNNLAMDISRAKNIDLASATDITLKVLTGQARELTNLGIKLGDNATSYEILAELQKKYSGQAEEAAGTWQNQMEVLSILFANMKEQIGGVLVEALMPFIKEFNAWLMSPETKKRFDEWTAEFKSWAEVIIPTIVDTFVLWKNAAEQLLAVLVRIGNEFLKIGSARNDAIKQAQSSGYGPVAQQLIGIGGAVQNTLSRLTGLQPFAEGGIVTGPTRALIGEAGPEAVIPLDRLSGAGIGGVTINITGTFLSEDSAKQVGDMIIDQFKRINKL